MNEERSCTRKTNLDPIWMSWRTHRRTDGLWRKWQCTNKREVHAVLLSVIRCGLPAEFCMIIPHSNRLSCVFIMTPHDASAPRTVWCVSTRQCASWELGVLWVTLRDAANPLCQIHTADATQHCRVGSRRRRRCVLGFSAVVVHKHIQPWVHRLQAKSMRQLSLHQQLTKLKKIQQISDRYKMQ